MDRVILTHSNRVQAGSIILYGFPLQIEPYGTRDRHSHGLLPQLKCISDDYLYGVFEVARSVPSSKNALSD